MCWNECVWEGAGGILRVRWPQVTCGEGVSRGLRRPTRVDVDRRRRLDASKISVVFTYLSGTSAHLPPEAQPEADAELAAFTATPTGWTTVLAESALTGLDSWGIASYLTPPAEQAKALTESSGEFGAGGFAGFSYSFDGGGGKVWEFEEGMADGHDTAKEFFVHRRDHSKRAEPSLEFRPSFLWYFQAIPRADGCWFYVDDAGVDHDLVRVTRGDHEVRVQIAALPLRRYLAALGRVLVVQYERNTELDSVPEPRIEAVERSQHRHFTVVSAKSLAPENRGFIQLRGKQVVLPLAAAPDELTNRHPVEQRYPHYIIDTDPESGKPVTASCDPDQLADHRVGRDGAQYLTRVYFTPAVLNRYTAQPSRYQIGAGRLSCNGLWGISIGTNPEGLVEAYLGDLGRDLPASERDYWASFNTAPVGGRDELRYRRDILNQWIDGPPEPVRDLFAARARFDEAMTTLLGEPVFTTWEAADQVAFEGLYLPNTDEQAETDQLIMRLAKGVVDYLNVNALRKLAGVTDPKRTSINCLEDWVLEREADVAELVTPIRTVQRLRSGGAAHVRGSNWDKTLQQASLADLSPQQLFEQVLTRATDSLNALADLAGTPEGEVQQDQATAQ